MFVIAFMRRKVFLRKPKVGALVDHKLAAFLVAKDLVPELCSDPLNRPSVSFVPW